jgi:hypothetical protein
LISDSVCWSEVRALLPAVAGEIQSSVIFSVSSPCLWTSPAHSRNLNLNRHYFKDRVLKLSGQQAVYAARLSVASQHGSSVRLSTAYDVGTSLCL